jgi:hypothetical protein
MVEISSRIEISREWSVDRSFDFIFFVVEIAATRRYEVAKVVKYLRTYLRFRDTYFSDLSKRNQ